MEIAVYTLLKDDSDFSRRYVLTDRHHNKIKVSVLLLVTLGVVIEMLGLLQ